GRFPRHVEINLAPATAKRLLLPRVAADRRMTMLRAGLPGPHRQLLGAAPLRVDVDQHTQPGSLEVVQAEVRRLDPRFLCVGHENARLTEESVCVLSPCRSLLLGLHRCSSSIVGLSGAKATTNHPLYSSSRILIRFRAP